MSDSVKCLGFSELLKQAKSVADLLDYYGIKETGDCQMMRDEGTTEKSTDNNLWVSVDVLNQWQERLKEKALEIDNPSNNYGEVCKQNRQYRILLNEVLSLQESPDSLSPEEIADVEASEKEIASGKCKVFETAQDLIADLHKTRKKGSLQEKKESTE